MVIVLRLSGSWSYRNDWSVRLKKNPFFPPATIPSDARSTVSPPTLSYFTNLDFLQRVSIPSQSRTLSSSTDTFATDLRIAQHAQAQQPAITYFLSNSPDYVNRAGRVLTASEQVDAWAKGTPLLFCSS